jgi:hypothetical protein
VSQCVHTGVLSLIRILQPFPPVKAIQTGLAILLVVCAPVFEFIPAFPSHIQVHQEAKEVTTSYDALLELLESIDHRLKPLDIYTRVPHTLAMDELVVKIMAELLSGLALTIVELKQGRSSMSVLTDVLPRLTVIQRDS